MAENPFYGATNAYPARFEHDDTTRARLLRTAHRMIENYCDTNFNLVDVYAEYTIDSIPDPLMAVEGYKINEVVYVKDIEGTDHPFGWTEDLIFPNNDSETWILKQELIDRNVSRLSVKYTGGLPTVVYDAIMRQAQVLATRPNTAPEIGDTGLDGLNPKYNTQYRSGLAPDIKAMVFPFRKLGV